METFSKNLKEADSLFIDYYVHFWCKIKTTQFEYQNFSILLVNDISSSFTYKTSKISFHAVLKNLEPDAEQ